MHSPSEPKKGAGYFASRLKEKGIDQQDAPKESTTQADENPSNPKYGQIFEESSKSIAAMAGDMNETAKLVSSMKEGLERVKKVANLADVGNPLCDPFGSCSYNGVDFAPRPSTNSEQSLTLDELSASILESKNNDELTNDDKEIGNDVSEYTTDTLSNLRFDADSIKDELQEFKDNIKQKEAELVEFRTKLNQARLHAKEFANVDFSSNDSSNVIIQDINQQAPNTEFDVITSNQVMNIDSIQNDDQDLSKLSKIQQEIKEEEKKLFEIRWKTKKAESEYEDKRAANESLVEVREVLTYLKPERDSLKMELNHLRNKIEKLEESYDEVNSRKREIQIEYDDLKYRFKKLESEYEDKKNSFRLR